MEEKDNISEYYRTQVEEILYNKLNPYLGDPLNDEETDEIWEDLSTELDIEDMWDDISSELDISMPSGSGSGIFIKLIAALIILLFGMIPVKNGIPDSSIIKPDLENRRDEKPAQVIIENRTEDVKPVGKVKENITQAFNISSEGVEEDQKIAQTESWKNYHMEIKQLFEDKEAGFINIADSDIAVSDPITKFDNSPGVESGLSPAVIPDDLGNIEVQPEMNSSIQRISDESLIAGLSLPSTDRGRFSAGIVTMFKNTWLLNHETLNGFNSESLSTTKFVFFPDAGLSLVYSLNRNWSFQADGMLFSNTGQKYLGYNYGHYSGKKITLSYSTIALSVKYKYAGKGGLPGNSSINLLAGTYVSVLHNASREIITNVENIRSQYLKYDFGFRLGGEIEFQLSDRFSLAPGVFMSVGIPNIYKGEGNIPGYLRRTHNGSEGFHLTLYHH